MAHKFASEGKWLSLLRGHKFDVSMTNICDLGIYFICIAYEVVLGWGLKCFSEEIFI